MASLSEEIEEEEKQEELHRKELLATATTLREKYDATPYGEQQRFMMDWLDNYKGEDDEGTDFTTALSVTITELYGDQMNHPTYHHSIIFLSNIDIARNSGNMSDMDRYIDAKFTAGVVNDEFTTTWIIDLDEEKIHGTDKFSNALLEFLEKN